MSELKEKAGKGARRAGKAAPGFGWIAEGLWGLAVAVGDVTPDPRNARTHSEANVGAIAESLRRFGQVKPIVVNRRNAQVVAGNGTLAAAKRLGWSHVAVVWVDHDEAAQSGYALADNRTAELAGWDAAMLAVLIGEVKTTDADLYDSLLLAELETPVEESNEEGDGASQMGDLEYRIIVECKNEREQARLLAKFEEEGINCRALIS